MIVDLQIERTKPKSSQVATKRCGLYIRVSTEMQTDGNSLNTQRTRLHQYVAQREWTVGKVFTEAGLSAKNTKRPALQQMLRWARDGKVDVVLVDKVDRISRNLVDLLNLIGDLKIWGVAFVSASQSFDTSTSAGNLMLNVLGSVAQFEREIIGDRVRENMLERARKGLWSGGIVPFGYRVDPKTKALEVRTKEVKRVKAIFAEFLRTRSLSGTCHKINSAGRVTRRGKAWSLVSIRRILSSPTYIGTLCYGKRRMRGDRLFKNSKDNWIIVSNAHPAIISKKAFKKVQAILSRNSSAKTWRRSLRYLLSSLRRCGICGSRIIGSNGYYRCAGRIQKGKSFCKGLSYRQAELEQAITGQILGFDTSLDTSEQRHLMTSILREFTAYPGGKIELDLNTPAERGESDIALSQYRDIHIQRNAQPKSFW